MPLILFRLPIGRDGIPVYTAGVIGFLIFCVIVWLGWRLARRAGYAWDTYLGWMTFSCSSILVVWFICRYLN